MRADIAPRATHPPGNTPYGQSRCKTCPSLMTTNRFTSHCTGKTYTLRSAATCKSKDVVYLIQCKRCGLQYVGETEQALNERLNSDHSDIKRKNINKPVAANFNKPGHSSTQYRCAEVWMTIWESGWNLWVWLVGVVSRRWVWLGGIYGYGYNV